MEGAEPGSTQQAMQHAQQISQAQAQPEQPEGMAPSSGQVLGSEPSHKPEEKQQVCSFYVRTASCAYGSRCRFLHPENIPPPVLNSRGLPIRPSEPSCAHYLKKGWCAFGMTCKFNHPELLTHPASAPLTVTTQGSPSMLVTTHPSSTILQSMHGQQGHQLVYTTTQSGSPAAFSTGLATANVLQGGASLQPGTTVYYLPTASGGFVPSVVQPQASYQQIGDGTTATSFTVVTPQDGATGLQALYAQPGGQTVYTTTTSAGAVQLPGATVYAPLGATGQLQVQQGLTTADGAQLLQPVVTMRGAGGAALQAQRQQVSMGRSLGSAETMQVPGAMRSSALQLAGTLRGAAQELPGSTVTYLQDLETVADVTQPFSYIQQQVPAASLHQLPMAGGFMQQGQQVRLGEQQVQLDTQQHSSMSLGLGLPSSGTSTGTLPSSLLAGPPGASGSFTLAPAAQQLTMGGRAGAIPGTGGMVSGQEVLVSWPHTGQQRMSGGTEPPARLAGTSHLMHAMQRLQLSQQQQQQQQQQHPH